MRFDHLVHWVPNLETAMQAYRVLGFTLEAGGQHPVQGTRNVVWRTGSAYIELLAFEDDAPAHVRLNPGWPALAALLSAGGGARPFAVLVDDVVATVRKVRARAIDVDTPRVSTFQRPDGSNASWTAAALREGPAWAPFFINYDLPGVEGITSSQEDVATPWSLDRIVIEVPDPAGAAAWLAHVLDICPVDLDDGTVGLPLPGCAISFARGAADRITVVVLRGADAPNGEIAGLRYVPHRR